LTSPYERPDRAALAELEPLVQALGAELATWRRRALRAEAELQEVQQAVSMPATPPEQVAALERESAELQRRLTRARELVDVLRTRLRFIEERAEGAA